jgi:Tol biopolymer transport system component/C-terminal processing protease CtpA/Prc
MSGSLLVGLLLAAQPAATSDAPLWMRYPAVSPDGNSIVFSYRGDLWVVPAAGGQARAITLHDAHDTRPVWSRDGSTIAFASDRYGNFDVFVMPAEGGAATRLTYHSAHDFPTTFGNDGRSVFFESSRIDDARNAQFPSPLLSELYTVSLAGGTPKRVLTTPAQDARWDRAGTRLVYQDLKGYEDAWRKHHTSSVTRDIWVYDARSGSHTKISAFEGEDRSPVWGPDDASVYYLSERGGSLNVWATTVERPSDVRQITTHTRHPVRHLTISNTGDLVYGFDGEIWRIAAGATEPAKVPVDIRIEDRHATESVERLTTGATELAVSPNGKDLAFVIRGEVFVTSLEFATTRRITSTPGQERTVSFSPDGRELLYAAERDGSWNVYRSRIVRAEEPFFHSSTLLEERPVVATPAEEFQPSWSPDGKEVAFLENRVSLRVTELATGRTRTVLAPEFNYSYSDGDQEYRWSPDGKHFLVTYLDRKRWVPEVGLVAAAGDSAPVNLSNSGYADRGAQWGMNGRMMFWVSDRLGYRQYSSFGSEHGDIWGMFFSQEALDEFSRSKEERERLKAAQNGNGEKKDVAPAAPAALELGGMDDRIRRLTIHSSDLAGATLTPDGTKLLYLARFDRGFDLWMRDFVEEQTKLVAKLAVPSPGESGVTSEFYQVALDTAGKNAFVLANGGIRKIELANGKETPVQFAAEMRLDGAAERMALFEHAWRQVREKFYVQDLHGVDWNFYRTAYARFLPHVNNNYDFQELLSELLGELNASHTGARYNPRRPEATRTAALGVFFDNAYDGPGLRIAEIMGKGPLTRAASRARAGTVLLSLDGVELTDSANYDALMDRKEGKPTLLGFLDPASDERWVETVQPISLAAESQLRYERWVESRRAAVDSLSGGRLGYVHIRGMNDGSFRETYAELMGRHADREAVVIDTRFNGGGWLHDELVTMLSGQPYFFFLPRGQDLGSDPIGKWQKPSVVVMSESNYSNAHMFPFAYKEFGIGELVGMPVPGTGTAVWWEQMQDPTLVFGIPQVGIKDRDGEFLENQQLEPDHLVENDPESVAKGRDKQLEKAVEVLMAKLRKAT